MTSERFTLVRGDWYAMTMYPGYGTGPYHSPVRVNEVTPCGNRTLRLGYLNAAYAQGVQNFVDEFKTVKRGSNHWIAVRVDTASRTYVFEPLNRQWFNAWFPWIEDPWLNDELDERRIAKLTNPY